MIDKQMWEDLASLRSLVREAGEAIMEVYRSRHEVSENADGSPVTEVDRRAHEILVRGLRSIRVPLSLTEGDCADLSVLSEEGADIPWLARREWRSFWLVDPLDGTKEYVKSLGKFTMNVALIEDGRPVLGIVYAPAAGRMYVGVPRQGAVRLRLVEDGSLAAAEIDEIRVWPRPSDGGLVVAESRSHRSEELEDFLSQFKIAERIQAGSSLKMCLVAEGKVDLYPRLGLTMEWDTAAGQAVVEAPGGGSARGGEDWVRCRVS